ncbi:unnamed protein product, partial [Nesidiocoris tenuis]
MEGKLERLMTFLRNEVEGEEKIALAGSGLGLDEEIKRKTTTSNRLDLPTAASLVSHKQKPDFNDQEVSNEKKKLSIVSIAHEHATMHSLSTNSTSQEPWYTQQFSKFEKTVRMIGWINRFITNS